MGSPHKIHLPQTHSGEDKTILGVAPGRATDMDVRSAARAFTRLDLCPPARPIRSVVLGSLQLNLPSLADAGNESAGQVAIQRAIRAIGERGFALLVGRPR
jgi:hypothetical protein